MPIEITVPRLGWSMEEGTFVGWLKNEGEAVRAGEPLFALESEKSTQDIEATDGGILRIPANAPKPGDTVKVGAVLAHLLEEGETPQQAVPTRLPPPDVVLAPVTGNGPAEPPVSQSVQSVRAAEPVSNRVAISPRAMRRAAELGVDWRNLRGTGRTGRIRECDVLAAGAALGATPPGGTPGVPLRGRLVPLSPMRRTIARRMSEGVHQAAPVTLTARADATQLVREREALKASATGSRTTPPTLTDILAKLTAAALQQHPMLNAQWRDDGIFIPDEINIAIAVDTEEGLLAPVVRDVAGLSIGQFAAASRAVIDQARSRRLAPEQLQGGTFTITNLGSLGIDAFTPILNLPQCAILGVGGIRREPVVVGDEVVIRELFTLSLTFDHRVVDGAPAARFLQTLRAFIESPAPHLTTHH
jgi:pyruvate dehydrogenase E2 component (dihydrolipoamide acetyltransferase)